jgi:DNA-binding transcriptional ArsR family regulator
MLDLAFQALAEPRRREILRVLADRELTAGEVAARFEVTRPAISQHLGVLRAAGLVDERRDGTRRRYRVRRDGLEPVRVWLDAFWREHLDALKAVAEAEHAAQGDQDRG